MLYLSGAVRPELVGVPGMGWMLTPNHWNGAHNCAQPWAADSGLWSAKGVRAFDLDKYLRWLWERRAYAVTCQFATAPDVVGDAAATWQRSRHVLPCIRGLGLPAALVAQDGWDGAGVDWESFDVLFIGGSTEFKLAESTYALAKEAQRRGKRAHMGRVNSWGRIKAAAQAGYDSADGTKLCFGPTTNLPIVLGWLRRLEEQPGLFGATP